jgi:hypothetical protein
MLFIGLCFWGGICLKVVNKPLFCTAYFDTAGNIKPLKFAMYDDKKVLRVLKPISVGSSVTFSFKGQQVRKITCTVMINKEVKVCELWYHTRDNKWYLYKL